MPNVIIRLGIDGDIDASTLDKIKTFYQNNKAIFSYAFAQVIDQPEIKSEVDLDA